MVSGIIPSLKALIIIEQILNIAAFISPYRRERNLARQLARNGNFAEVYVSCPLEVCIQRDPKGLYKRALRGEIINFTGIDAPYEAPEQPNLVIKTDIESARECVNNILRYLREKQFIQCH